MEEQGVLAEVALIARQRGLLAERDFAALAEEARKRRLARADTVERAPLVAGAAQGEPADSVGGLDDPSKQFGKFVLVQQVGQGGTGAVYRAYQKDLGRTVALKFLHSEDMQDVQRFAREAQTAAKLAHPHIVPVYEAGEARGRHYIAMGFVEGQPLTRLRLEPRRAVEIMRDAALAVQYAHEQGIIHRDLKPQNLMLGNDGRVRVMDFGLARPVRSGTTLTAAGYMVGTPAYMSPEQAAGRRADERSDVYSLGATLYELLTGHPPYEGKMLEVLAKVSREEPPAPRRVNPKVDREVETICLKAMEKDPARRYASARALAEDLRRHLEGEPILARPASLVTKATKWSRRHRATSAVGVVILAGVFALAGVIFGNAAARAREKRAAAARFVEEGRKARADHEALQKALDGLRGEEKSLATTIEPHEGAEKKQPLWDLQRKLEDKDEATAVRYTDIIVAFTSALGVDPDNKEAKAALTALYFAEFERSEKEGDRRGIKVNEKLVRLFDDGTYAPKLVRGGTITLDSNPAGAEVYVFRYEEGRDRRLMPRPYSVERRESRMPGVERTEETEYALEFSAFNRLGTCPIPETKLRGGSYLLVLRTEGYRDVRYPVYIERGTVRVGKVNLYTEEEIGRDFVYVPGGTFIMGGDKEAYLAGPREEKSAEDFFIGKFEVTTAEYAEFLNDRRFHDLEKAWERTPRQAFQSGQYGHRSADRIVLTGGHEKWPVLGISWDNARAYCDWMTRKAKERGEVVMYRLPTSVEWEKAARGADARGFPWGNAFDWSFTSGGESKSGRPEPDKIGEFGEDESPYGIRDMGGGMREWCGDWEDEKKGTPRVRGGGWNLFGVTKDFRPASRGWVIRTFVGAGFGFRLARPAPPSHK